MGTYQSIQEQQPTICAGKWSWCSSKDPYSKTEPQEYTPYSDADNMTLERAYLLGFEQVTLGKYIINFQTMVQNHWKHKHRQRPIRRLEIEDIKYDLRLSRFFTETPKPKIYENEAPHVHPQLVRKWMAKNKKMLGYFKLDEYGNVVSNEGETFRRVIDSAIKGIMEEGVLLGKDDEAKMIVKELENRINSNIEDVLKFCVYLYTTETFLYKQIWTALRDDNMKKTDTLVPFCYLLNIFLQEGSKGTECSAYRFKDTVYRGTTLSKEAIEEYINFPEGQMICWEDEFICTTKNRVKSEQHGNVLFVVETGDGINAGCGTDVSKLSCFGAQEEEVILAPGGLYSVQRVEPQEKKTIIYLRKKQALVGFFKQSLYTTYKTVSLDGDEKVITAKDLKVHKEWIKKMTEFDTLTLYHKSGFAHKVIGAALVSNPPFNFAALPKDANNIIKEELVSVGEDVVYSGEWSKDTHQPNGRGIVIFSSGRIYEGSIVDFEPKGIGRTFTEDGSIYEGEFHESRPNGKGKFIWGFTTGRYGDVYEGQILDSIAHGFGVLKYKSGDVYEGDWIQGERHGQGKMSYADGRKYTGDWVKFKRHGNGSMDWKSGKNYTGQFQDDFISGKGKMTYPDGKVEVGVFEKGILVKPE